MSILELKNVNKTYGNKNNKLRVLNNINIKIDKGDLVAVIGRSGSGKSTLLSIIGGLTDIDSGEIYYNNNKLDNSEKKMSEFRNKNIGYVIQSYGLIKSRTVFQNIELPLKYNKININQRKDIVDNVLKKIDMIDKKNQYPTELSGGECQRVAIARALINDAEIILADEPTGALDEETEKKIMDIFYELNKNGKTIIIVTHDIQIANSCKRIIKIKDGCIVE